MARRALILALAAAALGCARMEPPSGGPPDLTPPVIEASVPDSGAVNVGRGSTLQVRFSKHMDRRSVEDYIFTSPPVRFSEVRWSGFALELVPQDSLRPNTTYLAVIGTGARDSHGNGLARAVNLVFSTGPHLSPGRVSGRVEAVKQSAAGLFVWLYDQALHADSTWGRDDPDYVGQTGADGHFEILGLPLGPTFSAHVFADLNHNRSYDPESEYLLHLEHRVHLTDSAAVDTTLAARYVDPKLPASLAGRMDTSLVHPAGRIRVECPADSTATQTLVPDPRGAFLLRLAPPGKYRIYWFQDQNQDGLPDPGEAHGDTLELELRPGDEVNDMVVAREGKPHLPRALREAAPGAGAAPGGAAPPDTTGGPRGAGPPGGAAPPDTSARPGAAGRPGSGAAADTAGGGGGPRRPSAIHGRQERAG
ncbi:MAG TPA: Ig-like domain-containing protein [Candidatus Saccharimonadales bacterium]|nr:Ig-like domain-containing protein [Candidatus Saccharimonadales bacterium]